MLVLIGLLLIFYVFVFGKFVVRLINLLEGMELFNVVMVVSEENVVRVMGVEWEGYLFVGLGEFIY